MQPADYAKLIYQSAFAGGHLIADAQSAVDRLKSEMDALPDGDFPLTEPIGNGLARLYLAPARAMGLRSETVAGLFIESAASFSPDPALFEQGMDELDRLVAEGAVRTDPSEISALRTRCREQGYPPFSHSGVYRAAYAPAYRIVSEPLIGWLDLLAAIDCVLAQKGRCLMAIDGNSGSGKSTLARLLASVYGAQLFHMDDFFLPFERKTPGRLAEPGGNVDYERFQAEIGDHLSDDVLTYRPYVCHEGALGNPVCAEKKSVQLIEGVYSLHPALSIDYDLRVFLGVNPALQSERILKRNGASLHARFISEWIPMENRYFDAFRIPSACDIVYCL